MSKSCQEAFLNVRKWSKGPQGFAVVVGRPSRMSGRGQDTLPDVWEWSGGPQGFPGVVGRSSWISW